MSDARFYWRGFQADPENLPLPRPGIYLIRHIESGKCYIGISQNVAKRLGQHACVPKEKSILCNALRKYGVDAFEIAPLFYTLEGSENLPWIEATLIRQYATVRPQGFNLVEQDGKVGPYGAAFAAMVKEIQNRPEAKAKMSIAVRAAYAANPDMRSRVQAAAAKNWASPEARSAQAKRIATIYTDPEKLAKRRAYMAAPEYRARQSANTRAQMADPEKWAKNRAANKVAKAAPEYLAKTNTPEFKAKMAAASRLRWSKTTPVSS